MRAEMWAEADSLEVEDKHKTSRALQVGELYA